jgi:hypothetical protein
MPARQRRARLLRLAQSRPRVRRRSKGIKIVAPVMGGDGNPMVVNIKPAYVFDVSQTDERTPGAGGADVLWTDARGRPRLVSGVADGPGDRDRAVSNLT